MNWVCAQCVGWFGVAVVAAVLAGVPVDRAFRTNIERPTWNIQHRRADVVPVRSSELHVECSCSLVSAKWNRSLPIDRDPKSKAADRFALSRTPEPEDVVHYVRSQSPRWTQLTLSQAVGDATQFPGRRATHHTKGSYPLSNSTVPPGMVRIPGGQLLMGDSSAEGYPDERPVSRVEVKGFLMDRSEVTVALWLRVYEWALAHDYEFDEPEELVPLSPTNHPMVNLSWYDAVKWANARSEMENREAAYYLDPPHHEPYRRGRIDLTERNVAWGGDGYRLPTEAEWEWAARGGLIGQHYGWQSSGAAFTNFMDGGKANYWESNDPYESDADCATTPVGYYDGNQRPSGEDMANGYGLYDMAGNASEWCWDLYHPDSYARRGSDLEIDPTGPVEGLGRVIRGGSWISSPKYCRVSVRYMSEPQFRCFCYGLRLVISLASEKWRRGGDSNPR